MTFEEAKAAKAALGFVKYPYYFQGKLLWELYVCIVPMNKADYEAYIASFKYWKASEDEDAIKYARDTQFTLAGICWDGEELIARRDSVPDKLLE